MTGFDVLANTVFLTVVSAIIIFIISFIKGILARTSWGPNIPGEVWILVSVAFGVLIAVLANYNAIEQVLGSSPDVSVVPAFFQTGIGGQLTTGVLVGLQTKVVYAVSTPIAAVLKSTKEKAKVETAVATGTCGPSTDSLPAIPLSVSTLPVVNLPNSNIVKEIAVAKAVSKGSIAYVILDGVAYKYQPTEGE
jgi:hypothetical protein